MITASQKVQTFLSIFWFMAESKNSHTVRRRRGFHLHSEADTATSFFGTVKVVSFTQGLLQEKENVTDIHKLMAYGSKSYPLKVIASQVTVFLGSYLKN